MKSLVRQIREQLLATADTVCLDRARLVTEAWRECEALPPPLRQARVFAHVLDHAGGSFSGTPPLRMKEHYRVWSEVMSRRFLRLRGGDWPERHVLRAYGAKNEAEFFAVATEAFFERPEPMRRETPDLYEELRRFYGFDPMEDPSCGGEPPAQPS